MAGNPRNGRPYRRLCTQQRALGLPCWRCGHPIDYSLASYAAQRSRWAFTLDHAIPLSLGSAHRRCNSARGNRITQAPPHDRASRRW